MFYSLLVKAVLPFRARSSNSFLPRLRSALFSGMRKSSFPPSSSRSCDSQKKCNEKEKYRPDFKQSSTRDSGTLVPGRPRPKEKLKKFHTLILLLSKPPLNPFIVIFS
ncbi:MAG: hypothetical protein EBS60_06975 [Verrucomicrobia bacterium]|nr:hypothetical protein [Verrucomicrobiota bacterium]